MKCFYFVKHHKFFVFALALSFCLTFIRPVFTSASNDFSATIGTYIDGSFVDYPVPADDLLTISDLLIRETDFPIDYQEFLNRLDSVHLTSFFENYDPYNPSYYINVFYGGVDSSNFDIVLFFTKSSYSSLSDLVLIPTGTFYSFTGLSYFPSFSSFSLPSSFDTSQINYDYSVLRLSSFYSGNDVFSTFLNSTYRSNGGNRPFTVVGSSYSSSFDSYVDSFLSGSSSFCTVVFRYRSSSYRGAILGLGLSYGLNKTSYHPLFTSSYVYDNLLFSSASGSPYIDGSVRDYLTLSSYQLLSTDLPSIVSNGFILSSVPFVTPTPIPSPEWLSPTPFPTVTLSPIEITPIPQYLDPNVLGTDDNISDLNGFAGLLDQTFSNFDIFSLGSSILEYVYSFSGYFSFILIIPVICLIAFALGRLNQK